MNIDTTQAASSTAEHEDVFGGQQPTFAEYSQYRQTKELPARFKPAETVANDAPEETVDEPEGDEPAIAADSDSVDDAQEPPKPVSPAQKRILQLLAENKELKRKAEAAAKPDVTPESSPAPAAQQTAQPPQNYKEWRKDFDPSKWVEDYGKQNPTATYEHANAAMSDFLDEVRSEFRTREDARNAQAKEIGAKIAEAKSRYEDFDQVTTPFVTALVNDPTVQPIVKQMVNDSDVFADLAFTLAGDDKFMAIAKGPPGKAIRYIAKVESLIEEDLLKTGKTAEETNGKAPEKKVTQAQKPPSTVSGASSRAFDVSDESLSADEWARKRSADLRKRGKA